MSLHIFQELLLTCSLFACASEEIQARSIALVYQMPIGIFLEHDG